MTPILIKLFYRPDWDIAVAIRIYIVEVVTDVGVETQVRAPIFDL